MNCENLLRLIPALLKLLEMCAPQAEAMLSGLEQAGLTKDAQ